MGRKKRNRTRNRNNNQNNSLVAIDWVGVKVLKTDGDVFLVKDNDDNKFRIHKTHVRATSGFVYKGRMIYTVGEYLIPVKNSRLVVSNPPLIPDIKPDPKNEKGYYIYEYDIQCVASDFDVARFGFPIGTQYHPIAYTETPRVGDYVVGMRTGSYRLVRGVVKEVDAASNLCIVDNYLCPISEIGYRVINPEFLKSFNFANA